MRRLHAGLAATVLALLVGCGGKATAPLPDKINHAWQRTGAVREYTAKNLWKYVDGAADRYVQAGLRHVWTGDYRSPEGKEAVVDLFYMKNQRAAAAVFAGEHPADSLDVGIGDKSLFVTGSLVFVRGPYFVRITAFEQDSTLNRQLLKLGKALDEGLRRKH